MCISKHYLDRMKEIILHPTLYAARQPLPLLQHQERVISFGAIGQRDTQSFSTFYNFKVRLSYWRHHIYNGIEHGEI